MGLFGGWVSGRLGGLGWGVWGFGGGWGFGGFGSEFGGSLGGFRGLVGAFCASFAPGCWPAALLDFRATSWVQQPGFEPDFLGKATDFAHVTWLYSLEPVTRPVFSVCENLGCPLESRYV